MQARVVRDPSVRAWEQLKLYMTKKMTPADMKTVWKAMTWAPEFLDKACKESVVRHAWEKTGIIDSVQLAKVLAGTQRDASSSEVIMSSNPHYTNGIMGQDAEEIISVVIPALQEHLRSGAYMINEGMTASTLSQQARAVSYFELVSYLGKVYFPKKLCRSSCACSDHHKTVLALLHFLSQTTTLMPSPSSAPASTTDLPSNRGAWRSTAWRTTDSVRAFSAESSTRIGGLTKPRERGNETSSSRVLAVDPERRRER
jgi:hypothetical protein